MKWYKSSWFVILSLIFFFPLGLFLMWYFKKWTNFGRIIITVIVGILIIVGLVTDPPDNSEQIINNDSKSEYKDTSSNDKKTKISNEDKIKRSVKDELNTGKIEILGYYDKNINILIGTNSNISTSMTDKEVKHILGDTLVGIKKSEVKTDTVSIGVKVDGNRVVSSKWSKDAITHADDYKYKIYKNPNDFADQYSNNIN
ncbi:hypothetical protein AB6F53_12525 [Staphylococcus haemolyticus]|uniref:hypothetical protein n=1 Tax=Staphylococcus haemolyticus TaxID=1283 RepID=UPI00120F5D3F|nr:MAG: VanZ family protein [Gemella sp.]